MTYEKRKLTELREGRFPSQGAAAVAVGVSQATLSRWENGEQEPNSEYRANYAAALGISVADLGKLVYENRQARDKTPSAPSPTIEQPTQDEG